MDEKDEFETLQKNLAQMISDQEDLKKENIAITDKLNKVESIAMRQRSVSGSEQPTLKDMFGQALMKQEANIRLMRDGGIKEFSFDILEQKTGDMSFGTNLTNAAVSVGTLRPGIIGAPSRAVHIRDFLPQGSMGGSNYVFLKETATSGGPNAIPEGSLKSQSDFTLTEVSSPAVVIATYLVISDQMLNDVPSMNSFLQTRLIERLLVKEDAELLSGSGTGGHLSGLNTAGNFTAATTATSIDIEQLVENIGTLGSLGRRASGIILSNADYYSILLNKASTAGLYSLPSVVTTTPEGGLRIAGVPALPTLEQATGTFTIGAFDTGTALMFRTLPKIEFFVDSTLAKNNQFLVRAEMREALAIFGSTYIIKGSF
jgi:HK97 family phage major capsid protein